MRVFHPEFLVIGGFCMLGPVIFLLLRRQYVTLVMSLPKWARWHEYGESRQELEKNAVYGGVALGILALICIGLAFDPNATFLEHHFSSTISR